MKSIRFSSTLALALLACVGFAQKTPEPQAAAIPPVPPIHGKGESIIIHKNGDGKEKLTIVVDGDNVTINGKPAKDFKDGDVEVIASSWSDVIAYAPIPTGVPRCLTAPLISKAMMQCLA